MKKLAVLASGNGSNAENIHRFFSAGSRVKVEIVIYDRRNAGVAERMRALGVEAVYIPASVWRETPEKIVDLLAQRGIDLVVLAGFLRVIPPQLTHAYAGRMINIHPSLLPAYGGMGMYGRKVHEAVVANGETVSGVTVHYVSDDVDAGEILMQERVALSENETPETLEAKIHEVEYALFPRAIAEALRRLDACPTPPPVRAAYAPQQGAESASAGSGAEGAGSPTENTHENTTGNTTDTPTHETAKAPLEEWADTLGVKYNPEKIAGGSQPPQYPGAIPPPLHADEGGAAQAAAGVYAGNQAAAQPGAQGGVPGSMQGGVQGSNQGGAQGGPANEVMPKSYLVWAVVMTVLCCLPAGIVAIIFSSQVSTKFYSGDYEGAQRASERAQIWIIVSFVLGIMANTLYIPLALLFN